MQQRIKCTFCHTENEEGFHFCTYCGARLGSICPQCAAVVPPDSRFCPNCAFLCGDGRFGKTQHKVEVTRQEIICPKCGTPDHTGHRFCIACGTKLGIPCPRCDAIIEPRAVYCIKCGYYLLHEKGKK